MIKTEIITVNEEIYSDIICDCCGHSCLKHENFITNESNLEFGNTYKVFEYMELKVDWGYWSDTKDTETWTAQICEKCVDEKLSPIINFKKTNYM